jgi:hypothetical protein
VLGSSGYIVSEWGRYWAAIGTSANGVSYPLTQQSGKLSGTVDSQYLHSLTAFFYKH